MTTMPEPALPRIASRVVLRRLAPGDLAAFQAYRHDAAVGQYQGWGAQPDEASARFIAEMGAAALFCPGVWVQIGIADRRTDALIGDIGVRLSDDGTQAEIGFTLAAHAQGLGLASEAARALINLLFDATAATQIVATTDSRNLASIRLLERVGMHRVASADALFRDLPCVEHQYALPR